MITTTFFVFFDFWDTCLEDSGSRDLSIDHVFGVILL